jgi:periplasmic divalent cation tolerance protein
MGATDRFHLALTTAGSDEQAETLARALVERRQAACVNIVHSVCSVYRWKGDVTREEERLLLIKTSEHLLPEVRRTIRELHTYDVPEFVAMPITEGDPDYLAWLGTELAGSSEGPPSALSSSPRD